MSGGERLLVVEDERAQREALVRFLSKRGYEVEAVGSAEEALSRLSEHSYRVLISDLRLPGIDGLELMRRAHEMDEELGMLLVSAYASLDSAIEALRLGVHDYLLKPLIHEEVGRKIDHLINHRALLRENARLRRELQVTQADASLVARSPAMQEVGRWVQRAARTQSTVLITGETGAGKEVVARAIHRSQCAQGERPFLAINVATLPEEMVASELFGHERGAFTGAERRREGLLRAAGAGVVFLDEIGELTSAVQAKLLRALEAREILPLGRDRPVPFEARVIAATHRDLEQRISDGRFREDLYFRLNVLRIHVPSLRERAEDVPELTRQLLARHARRSGLPTPVIGAGAMAALCRYPWRGNVRELSNVLERALILADDGRLGLDQLPEGLRDAVDARSWDLRDAVERFERNHIAMVLRLCDGNRERAAEALGLSLATLYRRLEKLDLKGYRVRRGQRGAVGDENEA